ncbi:MAG: TonB-dependent receptor [Deltaproteobacteria bacterium]|nr:TonB-dependent receptor [Deltaproteobacteria bacterium]
MRAGFLAWTLLVTGVAHAQGVDAFDAGAVETDEVDAGPFAPDAGSFEPDAGKLLALSASVVASTPTSAASATTLRERDLVMRPHATPEDILRAVPGLVIAQHQGGGKADQLFLRGFDADHGTDVSLLLDGVPVNLPSHGHGQGYADANFLLPEVIDRVDVTKGPYYPELGDFDTAGAVNLRTRRMFAESSLSATYGSFDEYRVLAIGTAPQLAGTPWLAAAVEGTNGPFQYPEDLQRYNVFAKDTLSITPELELALLANAYGSQWSSSGQLPERAVAEGRVEELGSLDPSEGGQTQRQQLIATLTQKHAGEQELQLQAWVLRYRVSLFSDFTFALRDPVNLDEIEQDDARTATGLDAHVGRTSHLGPAQLTSTLGAQARFDDIHTQLWHVHQRQRLSDCFDDGVNPCDDAQIAESSLSAYLAEDLRLGRWLRVVAGVRGDLFTFKVDDLRPGGSQSGVVQASIANPKLQIAVRPTDFWELFGDLGGGFHSNDARAVIAAHASGALPRAFGAELGTRVRLLDRLELAATAWSLHLQSEQVFDADEDTTSAAGPTQRYGLELEGRYEIQPWLWADADLALAHAVFTQDPSNANAVALAPTRTGAAGLTALHPSGWKARLGMRSVADRPANADGSLVAQGYTLFEVSAAYRWRMFELGLVIENLLGTHWREAQFDTTTQLPGEAAPVTDVAFTPGAPRNGRITLSAFY